jgi:ectoine hydroxylase-related dioxygenase (phytanoyl-CoA dioxygenase family)
MESRPGSQSWAEPTQASTDPPLTVDQVAGWRERGFALVDGVIPDALLECAIADARAAFPEPGSEASSRVTDFGSGGRMTFPARSEAVNSMTLHPRLLCAVAQLLDVEVADLRLTQSDLWAKYGRDERAGAAYDNADQRMHVDYPNHTLTHPPRWDRPEAVEIILYLSDVASCGGATALVPRSGPDDAAYPWPIVRTPGVGALDWINDREAAESYLQREAPEVAQWRAEQLYPREVRARFGVGSVLFYRHDTWHRGTPLDPGTLRLAHNLTFRKAASEWISTLHPGWAWGMYSRPKTLERLIAGASVDQRCVLGFPAPGHAYWTRDTLDAVAARFGPLDMDMGPYERARPR